MLNLIYFECVQGSTEKYIIILIFQNMLNNCPLNSLASHGILVAGRQCSALLSLCTARDFTKTTQRKRLLTFHESGSKLTKLSLSFAANSTGISLESKETAVKSFSQVTDSQTQQLNIVKENSKADSVAEKKHLSLTSL